MSGTVMIKCSEKLKLFRCLANYNSWCGFRYLLPTHSNFYRYFSANNITISEKDNSPLAGIKVLDLTRIVAGPFCTMTLGDLGAEIIKIERPGSGDESRKWGPPYIGDTSETCYFMSVNRNKKSICVNLKSGKEVLYDLAAKCDVLVENYVPGKLDEYNLGYEEIKTYAPHLVYCSLTGYGTEGPYSRRPGYDVIAASVGGMLHITGPFEGEPCKVGVAMVDIATGLYAHGAIMAALLQRTRTGKGQKIDCNLLSTQVSCLINVASNYLNGGIDTKRRGTAHESIVPYQAFKTSDDEYLTIGTGSDQQFVSLCEKLNLKELAVDDRFLNNKLRVQNRQSLLKILCEQFVKKPMSDWLKILEGSPFPYGPINSIPKVFNDPHIQHIELVKELDHPVAGKIKVVGPPVVYSEGRNEVRLPPPTLGQHTEEILGDLLGYSDVRTVRLKLRKPESKKKVKWDAGTVDNEHLNKKKSKCNCVVVKYEKPREFGESSSSSSSDECENCHGHVERKKKKKKKPPGSSAQPDGSTEDGDNRIVQPKGRNLIVCENGDSADESASCFVKHGGGRRASDEMARA
ncbi:hypothetical protein L9F63_022286, partial [Diploptera punctata]